MSAARSREEVQAIIRRTSTLRRNTGCWLWNGPEGRGGYGVLYWNPNGEQHRRAHRVAYAAFIGDPGALHVCHTCDNPGCVNPAHLWLGTAQDNHRDKVAKGRANSPKGEQSRASKLTASKIRAIRRRLAEGENQTNVAAAFGVSQPTISHIGAGKTWSHVQ